MTEPEQAPGLIICPRIFDWSFFTPEERYWIRFNSASLGYTPLVEVNQALYAWSFRQGINDSPSELNLKTSKEPF